MDNKKEKLRQYKKTEKYREYNRQYQKQYRLKKKQNKIDDDNEVNKRLNRALGDKTKQQYIKIISRISNKNNVKTF